METVLTDIELDSLVEDIKKKRTERCKSHVLKDNNEKVYSNRSVSMDRIKYIGFDMDHTLVVYKSPEYDILAYDLAIDRLLETGYPTDIKSITYDSSFPVRGLTFDRKYGNLLKIDAFGNVLSCFHGFTSLSSNEIRHFYPNKYIQTNHGRIFHLDTLFHLSETFMLAALVNFFDTKSVYTQITEGPEQYTGVKCGDVVVTYQMIQQDIRTAINWAHNEGNLKELTLSNLDRYVQRDNRLPLFLHRLQQSGKKAFIATNSGHKYTQRIMTYIFDYPHGPTPGSPHRDWKTYFEYIIVDAKKPLFFQEGTMLREVDETSGSLRLGMFTGEMQKGKIFSGGSSDAFCKIAGVRGKEVLYVGDHIFGDIIKSKKEQAFRTFLVIPELTQEIIAWQENADRFKRLQNLEFLLTEKYQEINTKTSTLPSISQIKISMKATAEEIEESYPSQLGSLFRCGSRLTYFANQVSRFADLYSSKCVNLINYPTLYLFSSSHQLMTHETANNIEGPSAIHSPLSPTIVRHSPRVRGKLAQGLSIIDIELDEDGPQIPESIVED